MRNLSLLAIILASTLHTLALPGDLDTTFGVKGGYSISDLGSVQRDERPRDTAIQADGKIVVVGRRETTLTGFYEFVVARYNADGTLDLTFDGDGFFTLDIGGQLDSANAVAMQSDGRIVVAAGIGENSSNATIFRLNSDGTLDTTFDADGIATINASGEPLSMAVQNDGKIIFGTTFFNGFTTSTTIVRLNANGSLDTTFDIDGRLTVSPSLFRPNGLALQTDGKIVLAGQSSSSLTLHDVALIRLNSNGTFDSTFDGDGVVQTVLPNQESEARCVLIQTDGKIVIGGSSTQPFTTSRSDPTLIRYNSNGSLDSSFDADGVKIIEILNNNEDNHFYDIVQQSDDKIVGISNRDGTFSNFVRDDFFLTRFNSDGSNDNTFDANAIVKSQWCEDGTELALQTDGKIVAIGSQDRPAIAASNHGICVQRFNIDGSVDYDFNSSPSNGRTGLSTAGLSEIEAVAGLPFGKILVAGWGNFDTLIEARLIRLNFDGTLDTTFMNEGSYVRSSIATVDPNYFYDLKVNSDGSFYVAGDGGSSGGMIVKFTSAGVPDPTFSGDGVATTTSVPRFYAVAVQSDGKVIGCGSTGSLVKSGRVARFSATGTFETFATSNFGVSGNNSEILECGFQSDGKLVVAGYAFDSMLSSDFIGVSRHLPSLLLDTTFGTSGIVTTDLSPTVNDRATDLVVQPDDKIVISSSGIGANSDRDFAVLRYDPNGTLDPNFTENFGTNGVSLIDFIVDAPNDDARALTVESSGAMMVAGMSNDGTGEKFALAKLNANGTLRLGWGTLGRTFLAFPNGDSRVTALGYWIDGKVLAAGRAWNGTDYDFAIARYQNEGGPTAAEVSIAGRVLTADGTGIRNATITLSLPDGTSRTVRTGSFGYFQFDSVTAGETVVVSISSKSYRFEPSSQVLVVGDNIDDLQFVAQK